MRRFFLIALGVGIVALVIAALGIGAFPPKPQTHPVEKSVPAKEFIKQ